MDFKTVIERMKESPDRNVLAFVSEVEHFKRMGTEERHRLIRQREPEGIRTVVNDYIPFIVRVAYRYSQLQEGLSVLELVNEGVLGAYEAFDKRDCEGRLMDLTIRSYAKRNILNTVALRIGLKDLEVKVGDMLEGGSESWYDEQELIDALDEEPKRVIMHDLLEMYLGSRGAAVVMRYYHDEYGDYAQIGRDIGISRERTRQIAKDFTPIYKEAHRSWRRFSREFDLPVGERKFIRNVLR